MCFSVAEHMHLKQCARLASHPRLSGPASRFAHASPAEDGRALDRFHYPVDSPAHGVCALPRHTHTRHFATRIAGESIVKLAAGPADSFTVALISAGKNHRGHHFWLWWPFNSVYLTGFLFFSPGGNDECNNSKSRQIWALITIIIIVNARRRSR